VNPFKTESDEKSFNKATIEAVWQNGTPKSYASFRKDVCGTSRTRPKYGNQEQRGWEIDHIMPVSNRYGGRITAPKVIAAQIPPGSARSYCKLYLAVLTAATYYPKGGAPGTGER
jgi:hypothetical protein